MRPFEFFVGVTVVVTALILASQWMQPTIRVDRYWERGNLEKGNDIDGGIAQVDK